MRKAIPANERLALTLRFLGSGDSFTSLMYLFRIPICTVSRIVMEVCRAIFYILKNEYLKMPICKEEWLKVSEDFNNRWQFPNCIGVLDGKHINIKCPKNSGNMYFNYKNNHIIVLMALSDANYKFIYMNVVSPGRNSDGGIFNNTIFAEGLQLETINIPEDKPLPSREKPVPFVLEADDAFAMNEHLLKPYSNRNLNLNEKIFNYRLSRARRTIENVFGIISARFKILSKTIELESEKVVTILPAICVLHNFLMTQSENVYAPIGIFDIDDTKNGSWGNEIQDELIPLQVIHSINSGSGIKEMRDEFKNYFSQEGAVA